MKRVSAAVSSEASRNPRGTMPSCRRRFEKVIEDEAWLVEEPQDSTSFFGRQYAARFYPSYNESIIIEGVELDRGSYGYIEHNKSMRAREVTFTFGRTSKIALGSADIHLLVLMCVGPSRRGYYISERVIFRFLPV